MQTLFQERQRFTQWWLWAIVVSASLLVIGIFMNAFYQQLVLDVPWGDKPMTNEMLIVMSVVNISAMLIMLLMFFNASLEIVVDKDSVSWRYLPVARRWRRIEREAIQSYEIQKYYLRGYGMRWGFIRGKSVTVKGNTGIQFKMFDGSKLLLGTQEPNDFIAALDKMKHRSEN